MQALPVVTFTTDFGYRDHYLAAIKATLLSGIGDLQLVDVSNDVEKHNYGQGAFLLRSVWDKFPSGSIHVFTINNQSSKNDIYIAAKHKGHFFLGPDNGSLALVLNEKPEKVVQLNTVINFGSRSFPALEVLAPAAIRIARNKDISELGTNRDEIFRQIFMDSAFEPGLVSGSVIYNDSYGNAITNIQKDKFDSAFPDGIFTIELKSNKYTIENISSNYSDVLGGELVALFNSLGLLEIAVNFGNIQKLFSLTIGTPIRIRKK